MKLIALVFAFVSTAAFAHPGGHSLTCKSAARSGSAQQVTFSLARFNGPGWVEPEYSVTIDGKLYEFKGTDPNFTYGETFHNSPLGVINISANNYEEPNATSQSSFQITAIPSTVQAFDVDGNKVIWNIKDDQDECYDTNGKAIFQGTIKGYIDDAGTFIHVDTQILDCELTYDSGMAC